MQHAANFGDPRKGTKPPLRGEGTHPNPLPDGVATGKGEGESDQKTLGPAHAKIKGGGGARKEGGGKTSPN